MKPGDIVKIKNPTLNYENELRYTIVKVNKTTLHVYENSNPKHIYKGIRHNTVELI